MNAVIFSRRKSTVKAQDTLRFDSFLKLLLFLQKFPFDYAFRIGNQKHDEPDDQGKRNDGKTEKQIVQKIGRRRIKILGAELCIFEDRIDQPHQG